jgi:hypothetical protein
MKQQKDKLKKGKGSLNVARPGYKHPGYNLRDFRKHYRIRLDKATCAERKVKKEVMLTRQEVDAQIFRLKAEFDVIIRSRSFLTNRHDLLLCLFLPKLVAVYYLGLRSNNLVACRLGTNIIFGPDGSVRFQFDREDLRGRAPSFRLSKDQHGDVEEFRITLDVLRKYKLGFLDVIRSQDPTTYQEMMGDYFFARAASHSQQCMIKPYMASGELTYGEDTARALLYNTFRRDSLEFMNIDQNVGETPVLTMGLLRQIYYKRMRVGLGMS